jgi:hypothetical protein
LRDPRPAIRLRLGSSQPSVLFRAVVTAGKSRQSVTWKEKSAVKVMRGCRITGYPDITRQGGVMSEWPTIHPGPRDFDLGPDWMSASA